MTPLASGNTTDTAVHLQSCSFGYRGVPVVKDVDLTVCPGESLLILGCNGSGKSTVSKGILGLIDHLGGTATVHGHPIGSAAARTIVGYVPQRHSAGSPIPSTVWEVVVSGRLARKGWFGRMTAADREAAEQAIERVGLSDRTKSQVMHLSGGQQRRVLIARALASDPTVLFMDEPTAGVDAENQLDLVDTLLNLKENRADQPPLTLLIVSHDVGPLIPLAQRAIVMTHGRKTFDGSVTDLPAAASLIETCDPHASEFTQQAKTPSWVPGATDPS